MRRRRVCRWLGASAFLGIAGCLGDSTPRTADTTPAAPDKPATDWPTFGFDHQHTGVREHGIGPRTDAIAWTAIGDAPTVLCSPTVRDGTVYTGSAKNAVHAFRTAVEEVKAGNYGIPETVAPITDAYADAIDTLQMTWEGEPGRFDWHWTGRQLRRCSRY